MSKESNSYKNSPKKVYIRTFGCQMNERDSEWVMGVLLEKGFKKADSPEEANIVIFNTCSVRKHAEERAISNMGQLLKLKKKNPHMIFGIMGCTAEYYGRRLFERLKGLDFVCGTANLHNLFTIINGIIEKSQNKPSFTGGLKDYIPEYTPYYRSNEKKAYVAISRGCNNFCSYCIVPYVRGPERSRMPEDIINELNGLFDRGYYEITLLGQNVNSYGKDLNRDIDFLRLLRIIDKIKVRKKIKFLTSHPKDASPELFEAIRSLKSLSKELHLPLQSGSDKILEAMRRGYTVEYYLSKIKVFRDIVPNHRLTTDIIVGFPGETEEDFKATKRVLREVMFDASYIFKYSPRPPAPSSKLQDDVPVKVKERRHRELLELQKSISRMKKGQR